MRFAVDPNLAWTLANIMYTHDEEDQLYYAGSLCIGNVEHIDALAVDNNSWPLHHAFAIDCSVATDFQPGSFFSSWDVRRPGFNGLTYEVAASVTYPSDGVATLLEHFTHVNPLETSMIEADIRHIALKLERYLQDKLTALLTLTAPPDLDVLSSRMAP